VLHGRQPERAQLAALLHEAGQGRAGALVVHGEPGAGKSALLDDLVAGAVGARVVRTQGLESEAPLAFAALHRLLRPLPALRDRLPAPQARALRVAFGEEEGAAVDPFLVAVATLSALTEAAEDRPVLCVVDDAHWLDDASANALLFVARRLQADRVAMVFGARDAEDRIFHHDGVPALQLDALDATAAGALLAERAGHPVAKEVCEQLLTQAGGNPLALVELPTVLTPAQLSGTDPLPARLPLTAGIERVFLQRCRRLPEGVQTLLLVAAADDSGHLGTVRHAAALLGVDPSALVEAERSGLLVTEGDSVRVRHPVMRSAIYQAAPGLARREVHRALAAALGGAGDADRQAWHRAAAAEGPDEDVVAALVCAATRAERRGGYVAAAAAYQRAAELTADEQHRAVRLFAAARNAWTGGRTTQARQLAESARALAEAPVLRADIDRLRGRMAYTLGSGPDGHRILMHAVRAVAAADPVRAVEMAAVATVLAVYGGDSGASIDAAALSTHPALEDTPRARSIRQLLVGMTAAGREDWAAADAPLREALRDGVGLGDPDLLANLGATALHVGDDAAATACFTAMISEGRDTGAGMLVLYALPRLVFAQLLTGQWTAAGSSAAEALALSESAGQAPMTGAPLALLTLLAARQGNPEYDALLARLEEVMSTQPLGILAGPVSDVTRWAKGTRAAIEGDAGAAWHHLAQLRLPAIRRMAAVDLVDAAVRAGRRDEAAARVEELAVFAEGTRWPWALAAVDHGRALLAEAARAPELFERALVHHGRGGRPYERARTHLAYGEFLRRSQHRVDARTHLRQALDIFEELHADPLAARAAGELRASGSTARKRDPSTLTKLTPMELQVAQLVTAGMSNKEVAAQCWVSPRTVEFHLRNLFTKTGVTSRGELARLALG
jgi:DNA-binding CsgD family transcriptional regulator/tetratricopeptide (TPR) repeat protein